MLAVTIFLTLLAAATPFVSSARQSDAPTPTPTPELIHERLAVLRNRSVIPFERKEEHGDLTRLFVPGGHIDVPNSEIESFEEDGIVSKPERPSSRMSLRSSPPVHQALHSRAAPESPTPSRSYAGSVSLDDLDKQTASAPSPSPSNEFARTKEEPAEADPSAGFFWIMLILIVFGGLGSYLQEKVDLRLFASTVLSEQIPAIAAMIFLLLAAFTRWPYGLYVLLRFAVCGISIYLAIESYRRRLVPWVFAFVSSAILFNPLLPIHMSRSDWRICNVVGAALFTAWAALSAYKKSRLQRQSA